MLFVLGIKAESIDASNHCFRIIDDVEHVIRTGMKRVRYSRRGDQCAPEAAMVSDSDEISIISLFLNMLNLAMNWTINKPSIQFPA